MLRFALAALLLAAPAAAQETRQRVAGAPAARATIADAAWLVGTWRGPGIGGAPALETYTAPAGGQMSGHFEQLDAKGAVQFYEFIQIVEKGGTLLYRLKHFDAELGGWEAKEAAAAEEFALVAVEPGALHFDGLSLYRRGADAVRAVVRVGEKDGGHRELAFDYSRAAN
jgi:hypothetical protein